MGKIFLAAVTLVPTALVVFLFFSWRGLPASQEPAPVEAPKPPPACTHWTVDHLIYVERGPQGPRRTHRAFPVGSEPFAMVEYGFEVAAFYKTCIGHGEKK